MGSPFKVADTARMGIFSIDVQIFLVFFTPFFLLFMEQAQTRIYKGEEIPLL